MTAMNNNMMGIQPQKPQVRRMNINQIILLDPIPVDSVLPSCSFDSFYISCFRY
jgi:hypothetical protein